jgi:hypothetical protein
VQSAADPGASLPTVASLQRVIRIPRIYEGLNDCQGRSGLEIGE